MYRKKCTRPISPGQSPAGSGRSSAYEYVLLKRAQYINRFGAQIKFVTKGAALLVLATALVGIVVVSRRVSTRVTWRQVDLTKIRVR